MAINVANREVDEADEIGKLDYQVGNREFGQLVQISRNLGGGPTFRGAPVAADFLWQLGAEGKLFIASDADQNDLVTGQTSFADTTPTFLIDVPAGKVVVPLFLNLSQTGSVAGGDINVIIEIDSKKRYASSGTSEKVFNSRLTGKPGSVVYSGATAGAGYGVRIYGVTLAPDVSPAEGPVQGPLWRPEIPYFLQGPASFLVYTYAASTGPTWLWNLGFAEFDTQELVSGWEA